MQPLTAAMFRVRQAFYAAIIRSLLRTKSLLQAILNLWISPSIIRGDGDKVLLAGKRKDDFLHNVRVLFESSLERKKLRHFSNGLGLQLQESLRDNPLCMLPSYNHQLPTGDERGTYLALDVGGSTFRVALIELSGKKTDEQEYRILKSKSVKIDNSIKQLKGCLFFDWMAEKIEDALSGQSEGQEMSDNPLSMGLAWSFPIE
jgi:hexokinase